MFNVALVSLEIKYTQKLAEAVLSLIFKITKLLTDKAMIWKTEIRRHGRPQKEGGLLPHYFAKIFSEKIKRLEEKK